MSKGAPELTDYLRIFDMYPTDLSSIYQDESEIDQYGLLFEQLVVMLTKQSAFNSSLPQEFITSASRYCHGDPATVKHLNNFDNRHFMLCDLYDFIMLNGGLSWRRAHQQNNES